VNVYSRAAQGVRVMRVPDGARIIGLTVAAPEQEEDNGESPETPETEPEA
jgi:DNA gyrase C-terminal domain, beta-propeller.